MAPCCAPSQRDWPDNGYSVWSRHSHTAGYRAFRPRVLVPWILPNESRIQNVEEVAVDLPSHFHGVSRQSDCAGRPSDLDGPGKWLDRNFEQRGTAFIIQFESPGTRANY